MRIVHRVLMLVLLPATVQIMGCGTVPGDGTVGGGAASGKLQVTFDPDGGNFAVAEDEAGNQFTFRASEEDGQTIITEANVMLASGSTLKASLDRKGRPVNFRMSDNTAADIVYDGDTVNVRLTSADGRLIEAESGVGYALATDRVRARRAVHRSKRDVRAQRSESTRARELKTGMETYEEIVESIFDETQNPDSPLATNPSASELKEAAMLLGALASTFEFEEVDRADLDDDVTLDRIPAAIQQIAGNTYTLFDAEGFCIDITNIANRLTFDVDGILQSEFDRHLIFPDFSFGGSGEPGVTINFSSGTPVNLTPNSDLGFELVVTPIFTSTQLDESGHITIERRFQGDFSFDTEFFGGTTTAEARRLFDAAFINGVLSEDGTVLEFDLVLIDLADDNPAVQYGRLRYHDQNVASPERVYACETFTGEHDNAGLICPESAAVGEDFAVEYMFSREDLEVAQDFDWFVSDGYGFIVGDPFSDFTTVRPTEEGFMEVTLIVSDLSDTGKGFTALSCGVNVGRDSSDATLSSPDGLIVECPPGLNVGETGTFSVSGPETSQLEYPTWFVFGTSELDHSDPASFELDVQFYEPGKYEVAFQSYDAAGLEVWIACDVQVGGLGYDECAINGWYGDGICDEYCLLADPDCDEFHDMCELNGWYGDGECDDFCPEPDPDCEGDFVDECALNSWYGDGQCDLFCPHPDPDCDVEFYDICAENGWYGDGVCDDICPHPDPDCDQEYEDVCETNGLYGNGTCDEFCPLPDPDCDDVDLCLENGWYGDGECDLFCPNHDPDCGDSDVDICEVNGWYSDGVCDQFCPLPDLDCDFFDICEESGWYGDGECDEFCPEPDPDCVQ